MWAVTSQSRLILSPGFTVAWPGSTLMIRKPSLLATSRDNIRTTEPKADLPADIFERQSTRGREGHDAAPLILKTPSQTMASSLLPLFVWTRIHMSPSFEYITTYAERHWPRLKNKNDTSYWWIGFWFTKTLSMKTVPEVQNVQIHKLTTLKCIFYSQLSFFEKGCVKIVR